MKKLGLNLNLSAWVFIFAMPSVVDAKNVAWNTSVGVNIGSGNTVQQRPPQAGYPPRPHPNQPYPNRPPYPIHPNHPPYYKPHPPQGGVNLTYQAPTYNNYNQQTYMWVNGDPNTAQIKHSEYILISNWRELGLPAPPQGMHWIYENGRYILQDN